MGAGERPDLHAQRHPSRRALSLRLDDGRRPPRDHDPSIIWEGHRAGREIGYSHIEKLHNLESLPADGFQVACFPVSVQGGSAGWTRAVALLDDPAG